MFRNILSKTIQTFNYLMKQTVSPQHTNSTTASVLEDGKVDLSKVNKNVKQYSLFLARELSETRSKDNISSREAIGMLVKRWKKMKEVDKSFYSVIGGEEIGKSKSTKRRFAKNMRIIEVKKTDQYSIVTQEDSQSHSGPDDVTKMKEPQKLLNLSGFSVFMHHNFRSVFKKQPHLSSCNVFSKVATQWRNSTPQTRELYRQHAKRIRARYSYSISGIINFGELFEEVLSTSKLSTKTIKAECEKNTGIELVTS